MLLFAVLLGVVAAPDPLPNRTFTVDYDAGQFLLDGRPFSDRSGEIHYFRMHENTWESRLRQLRNMGLDTIQTYVAWNFHEIFPGQYSFTGNRDLAKFVATAAKHDLKTILRIGPYICAEWENGGFPPYVTDSNLTLRSMDERYLAHVKRWFDVLLPRIKPLMYTNGGSVLMIQIENEYGLWGKCDKNYMGWLRDIVWHHLGSETVLFTTDPPDAVECGSVEGVLPTTDFGPRTNRSDIEKIMEGLRKYIPKGKGPLVNFEYYPGWITKWNETAEQIDKEMPRDQDIVNGAKWMRELNISYSFYMAYGGTNPGYWNGAHDDYPVLQSYDYGAPIREDGTLRPLWYALRSAIDRAAGGLDRPRTRAPWALTVPVVQAITIQQVIDQLAVLVPTKCGTFADCGLPFGTLCYHSRSGHTCEMLAAQSYGQTYCYGDDYWCVENTGRINYPSKNSKWGTAVDDKELVTAVFTEANIRLLGGMGPRLGNYGAGLYRGYLNLPSLSSETPVHISFENWGRGVLFVNGNNIGRYWSIGPQLSIYVDPNYLKSGSNEIIFLEMLDVNRGCIGGACHLSVSGKATWTHELRP
ncbi:unnamed protein product, partial [Mesorhabditis spiculigera]